MNLALGDPAPTAAVVALKPAELAKSRLGTLPGPLRQRLAWTMAVDVLTALSAALPHVLVVSEQESMPDRLREAGLQVQVLREPGAAGLNRALRLGADALRHDGFDSVLACVGDLPALRPESVSAVLAASREHGRAFLADQSGIGTTMLLAHGEPLAPHFQGRSAAAHRASGAVSLLGGVADETVAAARRDVDTEVDLVDALRLGVGRTTATLVDPVTGRLGRYAEVQQDGRRRHAVLGTDGVLVAWD